MLFTSVDWHHELSGNFTVNGGINQTVSTELHKLTSKKNFLINELRDLWLNRGTANYLPSSTIYEINLSHVTKLEERNKFDTDIKQAKLSEKNLILETGYSNFGFDPTTRKFTYLVAFNPDPSVIFKRFDTITIVKPNSNSVNIFSTLKKNIEEFKTLHLLDHHICQVFLYFSKTYLPNNYSALSRFVTDATAYFEALLSLANSKNEVIKIRTALDTLRRTPGEPISSVLLKIDSLYSALYTMHFWRV